MNIKKRYAIIFTFCIIAFSFCAGWFVKKFTLKFDTFKYELHEGGYIYISPLLECVNTESLNQSTLIVLERKLQDKIKEYISNQSATEISIYFRDLNNGPWIGINQDAQFTPASLLKLPLLITYLKQAEKYPSVLTKKIKYDTSFSTITPLHKSSRGLQIGREYTIEELLKYMIVDSDNEAMALLTTNMDQETSDKTYTHFGVKIPNIRTPDDFMTVKEYATFFRILYNASYLNNEMSEKALKLLAERDFNRGIVAGVPENIKVASKYGEREYGEEKLLQLHDCGIVYYPDRPYLLCIMTRGKSFETLTDIIKTLSHTTYTMFKETQ